MSDKIYIIMQYYEDDNCYVAGVTKCPSMAQQFKEQENERDDRWVETWELDEETGERVDKPPLVYKRGE